MKRGRLPSAGAWSTSAAKFRRRRGDQCAVVCARQQPSPRRRVVALVEPRRQREVAVRHRTRATACAIVTTALELVVARDRAAWVPLVDMALTARTVADDRKLPRAAAPIDALQGTEMSFHPAVRPAKVADAAHVWMTGSRRLCKQRLDGGHEPEWRSIPAPRHAVELLLAHR